MCISVDLDKAVDCAEKINLYNEGKVTVLDAGNTTYEKIVCEWKCLISGAHEMPAFGVSLDRETKKEMSKGLWVEFLFDSVYESNGMPYEKLLVNVVSSFQGFNIIRYNSVYGYDGRCFYYDLVGKDMSEFYSILINI